MNDKELERKPPFYKNITDLPYNQRVDGNVEINMTLLPVVGAPIIQEVEYNILGEQSFTFEHSNKGIYDVFARMKEVDTDNYYSLPAFYGSITGGPAEYVQVDTITDKDITVKFDSVNFAYNKTWQLEIYFVDFKL